VSLFFQLKHPRSVESLDTSGAAAAIPAWSRTSWVHIDLVDLRQHRGEVGEAI
jgi:hypothetical protein